MKKTDSNGVVIDEGQIKEEEKMFVPSGKEIAHTFSRVYDEERKKEIVKRDGDFNIQEFIESCSNATDMAMLKERCVKLGEIPQSNPNVQYGVDEMLIPSDIHELNDTLKTAEATFNNFPAEVRAAFGNSYETYFKSVIAGNSALIINQYNAQAAAAAAAEAEKGEAE